MTDKVEDLEKRVKAIEDWLEWFWQAGAKLGMFRKIKK